jgi:hypothetical protein
MHKKVVVDVKPIKKVPLDLPVIPPLQLDGMQWYVVTENNVADIMQKLKAGGAAPVFFALDERGYEALSVNMTKIRAYMAQQKTVIVALKKYYEVPDEADAAAEAKPADGKPADSKPNSSASDQIKGMRKFLPFGKSK